MTDPQHTAYLIANKTIQAAKLDAAKRFFDAVDSYDSKDPDDITNVVRIVDQAFDLCYQADRIAKQMLTLHTHEPAIAALKRQRPGYSDETYSHAISEACSRAAR